MNFKLKSLVFPAGTKVKIYAASNWSQADLPRSGKPVGASVAEGEIGNDGSVEVSGLTEKTNYVAAAEVGGVWRYVSFRTAAKAEGSSSGIPISQEGVASGVAMLGSDDTVGGPGGSVLSPSVVSSSDTGVFYVSKYGAVGDGATDDHGHIESAIAAAIALAKEGGTAIVDFDGRKTYKLNSGGGLALTPNLAGNLKFRGNGAKIQLTAGCPRFLDCPEGAKHATYKNITVEDFNIDGGNVDTSKANHIIFGSTIEGATSKYTNFQNIKIRRIRAVNNHTSKESGHRRMGVQLWVWQDHNWNEEATQNWAKEILIQDVWQEGGSDGFTVAGMCPGGIKYVNALIDDVTYERCTHLSAPEPLNPGTSYFSANFQIGDRGIGGKGRIIDCYGTCSGDVGVETDGMTDMVVERTVIEDAGTACFLQSPHGAPLRPEQQLTTYRNCEARRHFNKNTSGFVCNDPAELADGEHPSPVGYWSCVFHSDIAVATIASARAWQINSTCATPYFAMYGCRINVEGFTYETNASLEPRVVALQPKGTCTIIIKDLSIRIQGEAKGEGLEKLIVLPIGIQGGPAYLDIDNVRITNEVAGCQKGVRYIEVGRKTVASTARGRITNLVPRAEGSTDTTPKPIYIAATLAIDGSLIVEDLDCRQMGGTGNNSVVFDSEAASLKPQVFQRDTRYKEALAIGAVVVGESPFVYRNEDTYREQIIIRGGNVSNIEISVDGVTYKSIGAVDGVVTLPSSYYLRVTYSEKPTMEKVPFP